jgi:glycosyltransferase involved in cell wall biosynthesis
VVPDPAKEPPQITDEQARAALGLPRSDPILLFFGNGRSDKGPDVLLAALPQIRGSWVAVFAGERGVVSDAEVEACRRRLDDPGRVITRFGYVTEADADRYFRAADVVILPYRSSFRGTSGILQRAAASGKPVVATDVGDVGRTVREEGLGFAVPPESPSQLAEAIGRFLDDRGQISFEVGPKSLRYARTHDWRILGSRIRTSYEAALARA